MFFAELGEQAGFRSLLFSDQFHPWLERQGGSPFVWSLIGAIAATTERRVTTGVTCPTFGCILPSWPTRPRLRASSSMVGSRLVSAVGSPQLARDFEPAASSLKEEMIADEIACGPDPERHCHAIAEYLDAGFDEVYVSQIGEDRAGFLDFFFRHMCPKLGV